MPACHGCLLALVGFFLGLAFPAWSEPPRRDAYGDPLPQGVRFRLGTVRLRHDHFIHSLAWLPDGRTLATAAWDGTVRLWQIDGGRKLGQWNKADKTEEVLFSPDGRIAACGGKDRAIRLIEVATGKERCRLPAAKNTRHAAAAFSPDGKLLAVDEWQDPRGLYQWIKSVRLYAMNSGKEFRRLQGKSPSERTQAFSTDGRTLVVAAATDIDCWNLHTGEKSTLLVGGKVNAVAFSPEGQRMAAVITSPEQELFVSLRSWPANGEILRFPCDPPSENVRISFTPDGKQLAIHDGRILLYDVAKGAEVRRFMGGGTPRALAFSRDGAWLASTGADNLAAVWELQEKRTAHPLIGMSHRLHAVAATADGRTLLTLARDGSLNLWDGRDGRRLRTLATGIDPAIQLRLAPDGSRALTFLPADGKPAMNFRPLQEESPAWWDVVNGRRLPALSGDPRGITCAAFSPDRALLALGDSDGLVHLREAVKGGVIRQLKQKDDSTPVADLAFSPDGRALAAGYRDGNLILWNRFTNRPHRCVFKSTHNETGKMVFSADSRLLAEIEPDKRTILLIETASASEFRRLRLPPPAIGSLTLAPDNRTLAIGDSPFDSKFGAGECAIRLWDWPSDRCIHVLHGHQGNVHTLAFSADGASLFSGSEDETVLCWDIADRMHRRPAGKQLTSVRFAELWTDLAAKDAVRGQRAVAELILSSDSTLPFLAKALPPVPQEKTAALAERIADLDHTEFARRDRAFKELKKMGEFAAPALRKALEEKPTLELRKRITDILESNAEGEISADGLRTLRALQALEAIGTPQARKILDALAHGAPEARLTLEAKAALHRLLRRRGNR